jgi:hypothetical protein
VGCNMDVKGLIKAFSKVSACVHACHQGCTSYSWPGWEQPCLRLGMVSGWLWQCLASQFMHVATHTSYVA